MPEEVSVPIVEVSTFLLEKAGMNEYLSKPLDEKRLLHTIRRYIPAKA